MLRSSGPMDKSTASRSSGGLLKLAMKKKIHSVWYHLLFCIIGYNLVPGSIGCILLLNGWTPLTVYERTGLADIVVAAYVRRTFKERQYRSEAQTYFAEINILETYKGDDWLRKISHFSNMAGVYNVSNFGEKLMCYADVMAGESYILFLTEFKGRLSAKYDDIFGAAAPYTEYNERAIFDELGWDVWSSWSECSSKCEGGYQTRERKCNSNNGTCDGNPVKRRQCNLFPCKGIRDLLDIFGVVKLPRGVSWSRDRKSAYYVTQSAQLFAPVSSIFKTDFPTDFSIIMVVKFPRKTGYLLTLSDIMGKQKLAVKYGDRMKFEYYNGNDIPEIEIPEFDIDVMDDDWHFLAFSVQSDRIELYFDCESPITKPLKGFTTTTFGRNLVLALGPFFARYGMPFQGGLEQLLIVPDPNAAKQQCFTQVKLADQAIKDDSGPPVVVQRETTLDPLFTKTNAPNEKVEIVTEWSSWSACSVTCGEGLRTRTLYCPNNMLNGKCSPDNTRQSQTGPCYQQECHDQCPQPCLNGGTCSAYGKCICPFGFLGNQCQNVSCYPGCLNGGRCLHPGQCLCTGEFTGKFCETALCNPSCLNGGRCITPGYCSCPYGYMAPICKPFCSFDCQNGGKCIRHNMCKCRRGYTGADCSKPVCKRGCYNGGRCVARGTCSCPRGYTGSKCHMARCNSPCQNNGSCIHPDVCKCRSGFTGPQCQHFKCRKCFNGGRCRGKKCHCQHGYYGERCERRKCTYEKYVVPYQRTYRKLQREEYTTKCGPWRWKNCVKTRLKYVVVSKMMNRTDYRCV
ncbi:hypothetical protein ScPMuIL_012442 [Solemya velum]